MERIVDGHLDLNNETPQQEVNLRPQSLDEFPGQDDIKSKLRVYVEAAKIREQPLDHVLLCGPPGLGKTTLAHIIANHLEVNFKSTSGPALHRKGDLAAILTSLKPNSVLFVDEIHRLNKDVEEYLYSAMEDYFIDIVTGDGLGARSMRFQLAPFTLIGATTRAGLLKAPFRDRFGILERLNFYMPKDLQQILLRSSQLLGFDLSESGAHEIARRSRGTPRIANRLLKRVRDYAQVKGQAHLDEEIARYALKKLKVDDRGLDEMDRRILSLIGEKFSGGPVGIDTLAAAMSEESHTIEEVYEPFLIQEGMLQKTSRGRIITVYGRQHLGLPVAAGEQIPMNSKEIDSL